MVSLHSKVGPGCRSALLGRLGEDQPWNHRQDEQGKGRQPESARSHDLVIGLGEPRLQSLVPCGLPDLGSPDIMPPPERSASASPSRTRPFIVHFEGNSMKRVLIGLLILIVLVVAGFSMYVASRQDLTFEAPMPAVAASTDSAVVERGRYVVRNLATCPVCHGDPKQYQRTLAGEVVPLSGGFEFNIPPGKFYPRNITPDAETGIGRFSDGAIARALRYGVGNDGRALLPFMEM